MNNSFFSKFISFFTTTPKYCWAVIFSALILASSVSAEVSKPFSININKASAVQLADVLDGVGETKAQAIVEDRRSNGAYTSVEALMRVKGIGQSTIDLNRSKLRIK